MVSLPPLADYLLPHQLQNIRHHSGYDGKGFLYDGKFYPLTETGSINLGHDLHRDHKLPKERESYIALYQSLCQHYQLTTFCSTYESSCGQQYTPEQIFQKTFQCIREPGYIDYFSLLIKKMYTHVTQPLEAQVDRIDQIFQKMSSTLGFQYAFRIRRIFTVAVLATGIFATGFYVSHPVLLMPLVLGLARGLLRHKQQGPLQIQQAFAHEHGHCSPEIAKVKTILTLRDNRIQDKIASFIHQYLFLNLASGSHTYHVATDPHLRFDFKNDAVLTHKEWLRLCRTILSDHQGEVTFQNKTYQIRSFIQYNQFVTHLLPHMIKSSHGDLAEDFHAPMLWMASYSQSIPQHLRLP